LAAQEQPDFRELGTRLMAYGLKVFAELGLFGRHFVVSGVGMSLEDFVAKVLTEYAEGKIKHHSSRGSLMSWLGTALKHDVLDALDKSSHKREEQRSAAPPTDEHRKRESEKSLDELPGRGDPVDVAFDEEEYKEHIRAALADEPELRELAELVFDVGVLKPQEIADFLGVDIQELHNRRRKLRRRLLEHQLVHREKK
jgi:DNA-directed RNA polymerase specialized sigma24 family protein